MKFWYNYPFLISGLILFWKSNWKMMLKNIYNEIFLQIYSTHRSYNSGSAVYYISSALSTNLNFYNYLSSNKL